MNQVEKYKVVDLPWIKEIPDSWTLVKPWTIFSPQKREPSPDDEVITCFRDGEVTLRKNRREDGFTVSIKEHGYQRVLKGDLVVHEMDGFEGSIGVSDSNGKSTPVYTVIEESEKHNNRYWMYMLRYLSKTGFIESLSKSIRERTTEFRWNMWKGLYFPLPPINEQYKISKYLDHKLDEIDELVKKVEKNIELLKEQKTSLINEVVTKGLNPNVEMKDSGIEWVGQIPNGWEVLKLKRVGKIFGGLTGKSGDDFGQEDSPLNKPYIPYTNIFRNTYISREHFDLVSIEPEETQNNVKRLDLFFLMSSENYDDLGKTSILVDDVGELYLNSFCKGFRVNNPKVNPLFLNYQLNGDVFKKLISINGFGFTRINLRQDKLLNISILLPQLREQEQIVMYLDKKTKHIDELILKEEKRIELLKEYKQSLISEVVTGKKRVV